MKTSYGPNDYRNGGDGIDVRVEKKGPGQFYQASYQVSNGGDKLTQQSSNFFNSFFDSSPINVLDDFDLNFDMDPLDVSPPKKTVIPDALPYLHRFLSPREMSTDSNLDTSTEETDTEAPVESSTADDLDIDLQMTTDSSIDVNNEGPTTEMSSEPIVDKVVEAESKETKQKSKFDGIKQKITYGKNDFRNGGKGVDVIVEKVFPGGKSQSSYLESSSLSPSGSSNSQSKSSSYSYSSNFGNGPSLFSNFFDNKHQGKNQKASTPGKEPTCQRWRVQQHAN